MNSRIIDSNFQGTIELKLSPIENSMIEVPFIFDDFKNNSFDFKDEYPDKVALELSYQKAKAEIEFLQRRSSAKDKTEKPELSGPAVEIKKAA